MSRGAFLFWNVSVLHLDPIVPVSGPIQIALAWKQETHIWECTWRSVFNLPIWQQQAAPRKNREQWKYKQMNLEFHIKSNIEHDKS